MLIDVRTTDEYNEKHHDDAVNIPVDQIASHVFTVPFDEPIVVHCRSGARAHAAQDILTKRGFTNVSLLHGTGAY
jgi:phage shock protein E